MTEDRKPTDLTLFGIQTSIVELLAFRDDVEVDRDMTPAEIAESLKACDEQIQQFLGRELVKVDGVAHVLREMEARAEVAKQERDRLNERARTWQKRHDWLEERVKEALQFRLQATGQKKLEGETSTLSLRKNPPSVDVRQPDLVPMEMRRITITMPENIWNGLVNVAFQWDRKSWQPLSDSTTTKIGSPEPMKAEILKELKLSDTCPKCNGNGCVGDDAAACDQCGGTGKIPRGVSGCVLVTDKVRLVLE